MEVGYLLILINFSLPALIATSVLTIHDRSHGRSDQNHIKRYHWWLPEDAQQLKGIIAYYVL